MMGLNELANDTPWYISYSPLIILAASCALVKLYKTITERPYNSEEASANPSNRRISPVNLEKKIAGHSNYI